MKNAFYAAMLTVWFLSAGPAAQSARAALMFDNPTPLKYERYDKGYFEKNNSGLTESPRSFLMFYDMSKFDTIFAPAGRSGGTYLPDDIFETRFIFAVVKRGSFTTSYLVTNVVRDFDKLRVYYEAQEKPIRSQTLCTPLILAIDNVDFDYSEIIVTENGKDVFRQKI